MVANRLGRAFGFAVFPWILVVGAVRNADAGWIASNLGTGRSFSELGGYSLAGPAGSASYGDNLAVQFQVSAGSAVVFGGAELALQYHSGDDAIQVLLMSDAGGIPGAVLGAMDVSNLPADPSLVTVKPAEPILLEPGTNYWLSGVASGDSYLTWMMNDQGQSGHLAYQMNLGGVPLNWMTSPGSPDLAYQIDGVSSPPSVVLVGSGIFVVTTFSFGTRKLRRFLRAVNRGLGRRTIYQYFY